MGREWLYWGGSSKSRKRSRSSSECSTTCRVGCMSVVLQIFDSNHCYFPFPLNHPTHDQEHHPKGVEAPRNSLELEEPFNGDAISLSPPSITKHDGLNIPPMGIQVRTSIDAKSSRTDDLSSEFSSSPSTKTPNLVARLMGLDLLPETSSPSSSSSSSSKLSRLHPQIQNRKENILRSKKSRSAKIISETDFSSTRSLPGTPRISSARWSDVEHHRFSLQSNKENSEEIEFPSHLMTKLTRRIVQDDENRSPGHYARQIVKQVKESISRRVGTDITNNVKNREQRRDQDLLVLLKSKKSSNKSVNGEETTMQSRSPRLRLVELKENKSISKPSSISKNQKILAPSPLSSTSSGDSKHLQCSNITSKSENNITNEKCKNVGNEKYDNSRMKKPKLAPDLIRNKQDEPFVRSPPKIKASYMENKCKKTPLSSNFLNINVPSSKFQEKKLSEVHEGQSWIRNSQLSRNLSQSYKLEGTHTHSVQIKGDHNRFNIAAGKATANGGGSEVEYIPAILNCTGIDNNTLVSFTNWYSPSHPLNPCIFHQLEISCLTTTTAAASALDYRTNRKLIFDLVDELLVEILKPYMNLKPSIPSMAREMNGSQLIQQLCCKVREFPLADCKVLEDIDRLIGDDLGSKSTVVEVEELEEILTEIEREIMEAMVHETATIVWSVHSLKKS